MEDDELIYKKLSGDLSAPEEQDFARRLAVDPRFAAEYDLQRSAIAALQQAEQADLKGKLRQAYHVVRHRKQRRRRWLRVAAAVAGLLLVLGGGWGYVRYVAPPTYAAYYQPYQPYPEMRGPAEDVPFAEVLPHYQRGDYAAALPGFQAQPRSDERDLYLGNCYWQLGQVATAQQYFATVARSDRELLRQHGEWYLALSYLRQDDIPRARALLQDILSEEALYYKEAQQLLTELPEGE